MSAEISSPIVTKIGLDKQVDVIFNNANALLEANNNLKTLQIQMLESYSVFSYDTIETVTAKSMVIRFSLEKYQLLHEVYKLPIKECESTFYGNDVTLRFKDQQEFDEYVKAFKGIKIIPFDEVVNKNKGEKGEFSFNIQKKDYNCYKSLARYFKDCVDANPLLKKADEYREIVERFLNIFKVFIKQYDALPLIGKIKEINNGLYAEDIVKQLITFNLNSDETVNLFFSKSNSSENDPNEKNKSVSINKKPHKANFLSAIKFGSSDKPKESEDLVKAHKELEDAKKETQENTAMIILRYIEVTMRKEVKEANERLSAPAPVSVQATTSNSSITNSSDALKILNNLQLDINKKLEEAKKYLTSNVSSSANVANPQSSSNNSAADESSQMESSEFSEVSEVIANVAPGTPGGASAAPVSQNKVVETGAPFIHPAKDLGSSDVSETSDMTSDDSSSAASTPSKSVLSAVVSEESKEGGEIILSIAQVQGQTLLPIPNSAQSGQTAYTTPTGQVVVAAPVAQAQPQPQPKTDNSDQNKTMG
jgi:hypothetical protein